MFATVIYVRDHIACKWAKKGPFNINNAGIIGYVCGKLKFDPSCTPYTKNNFIEIKDLNIKSKHLKLLEEPIEYYISNLGLHRIFKKQSP